jgi:signal transduction histidine kinase
MNLDLRTLALLLAVVTLVTAVILYLFYRLLPETPGLKQAAIGAGCQSLASLLMIVREFLPPVLAVPASNGLYFLSFAFFYQAARSLSNQASDWRWPGLIIILLLPPFVLFHGNEHLGLRIVLFSAGAAVLTLMTSWILLREIPANLPARRGAALAIGGIGLVSVYRLIVTLINPPGSSAFLDLKNDYLIFIWAIISAIVYAFAMVVMTSERLREALALQLQVADNALQEHKNFVTMLSHEFRTPLGIIKANVDAVFSSPQQACDAFTEDSLNRIGNATTRLSQLVDGCLNEEWISNAIETGELKLAEIDIRQLLRELCDEYRVNLDCNTSARTVIEGDRHLIPILFSSLIDNAKKYAATDEGVKVRCFAQNELVIVEVEDDGPGIPQQERERIFEKYYRSRTGNKRPGTGLGLFFVKRISEQHGGKIEVEQHQGALFRVILPTGTR